MDLISFIGFIAGLLTTVSFLPQAIKTWKSKSTRDISLVMFSAMCAGVTLWLIYGILLNALPIILSNSFTLILALVILGLKIRYK